MIAVICAALIVVGWAWRAQRRAAAPEIACVAPFRPSPVQPGAVPASSDNAASPLIRSTPAHPAPTDLPKEQELTHRRPARERSSRQATPRTSLPSAATACPGLHGAARARCFHPAVLAADAALRRAYADAEAAGVPRATLGPVRDRWAEVNSRFSDDPDYMIANLRSLAKGLRGLRRADRQAR